MLFLAAEAHADIIGHHEGARDLYFSDNGKIAFSGGADSTRVWDVESKQELPELPVQAGSIVAVAEDGKRVLCRHDGLDGRQKIVNFTFWWRPNGVWQKGTQVRSAATETLLDAIFMNGDVILLWEQSIERRGANGILRYTKRLKGMSKWPYVGRTPTGALSHDGTRAICMGEVNEQLHASVYDATKAQLLMRIKLDPFDYHYKWGFSPDAKVIGAVIGEPVEPWGPNDGRQPSQFFRYLWDVHTGKELGQNYDLSLTFLPDSGRTLLMQSLGDTPGKLELYDVTTEKMLPLPFLQSWGKRALKSFRISSNGKELLALDEKGDIWLEPLRSIS